MRHFQSDSVHQLSVYVQQERTTTLSKGDSCREWWNSFGNVLSKGQHHDDTAFGCRNLNCFLMPPVHFYVFLRLYSFFFSSTRSTYYDMESASASIPHISQHDQLVTLISNITCAKSSSLSFIKGFILGQLSVIVVVVLVLRYLFTEDVKRVNKVIANDTI